MQRDRRAEFKVGLFVVVALVVAGTLAFIIGNQRNVFRSKVYYSAVFDSVGGLRKGSPVRIAGVSVGTVTAVDLGDDGRIHVELGVIDDASALIRVDGLATIGTKGLLGDRLLDVSVGEGAQLDPGGAIPTETPVGIGAYLAKAGRLIDSAETTVENLRRATAPLADEQFGNDVRETAHNLALLTRMAAREDGTVRRLLEDPRLADDLHATVTNARDATGELARTARSARAVIDQVRTGRGSAHELLYGQDGARLVSNLADATGEAATLMRDVRTGDGVVHDLVYEETGDELASNLTAASTDLRAIIADVRAGRGTIGALLVDPSIYEDVKRLVGNLQRNEILRALVRYSIRHDEARGTIEVGELEPGGAPANGTAAHPEAASPPR